MGFPQAYRENTTKMDDLGVPLFQATSIYGCIYIYRYIITSFMVW